MAFGIDYVTGPPIANMKAAGVSFVCRYLSEVNSLTQVKILQPAEAKMLGENGIAIVSNFEWYANRATEGFASGVADAQIAASQHVACGGPPDKPIYFSVDIDTTGQAVLAYFQGVASVIGLHRTGAYGSYRVIQDLFNAGAIAWGWQTYAWSGGAWEPRAQIRQYQNGVSLAGYSVDYNQSMSADFGQWMPGGQGESMLLQLIDPMGKFFTEVASDRWHCTKTNQDIAYALLAFYRSYGGIFGLPVSGEIYLQQYPNTAIQYTERAILVYDPKHTIDDQPGAGDCYLLHIDSGIGQRAVAKPLLDTLTAQVASMTSELATLKAQPTPDTSVLEAQITALETQLAAYKQAIANTETAFAALPK